MLASFPPTVATMTAAVEVENLSMSYKAPVRKGGLRAAFGSRVRREYKTVQALDEVSIEPGDEILTVGGIYGIVEEIDEEVDLVVEIAEGIQVRVSRRAVAAVVKPEEDEDDEEDDEEPDEEADDGAETESEEAFDEPDGVGTVNDREDEVRDEAAADPSAAPRS